MFIATTCLVLIKCTCPLIPFYFSSPAMLASHMGLHLPSQQGRDRQEEALPGAWAHPPVGVLDRLDPEAI